MNYNPVHRGFFDRDTFRDVTMALAGCTPKAVHADRPNFYLHDLHLGGDPIGSRAPERLLWNQNLA